MDSNHNLPLQLTSFVGREKQQAEVKKLLASTRLLTITGPGGVGKTRLALRVATELASTNVDGVRLIALGSLTDGSLVAQTMASVLGVQERPNVSLVKTIAEALSAKRILLLIDNCEHVLSDVARLVDHLLRANAEVRVLATSRENLNIEGETAWRIPALTLPPLHGSSTLEQLRSAEAVRLFEERAKSARPNFELDQENAAYVAEVCHILDGMPLALELAAARVSFLAVDQIAARLSDRISLLTTGNQTAPTRQQTIRATIDWSYDLLAEREQLLFDRLSVFAGGWTLEAVEAVGCGDGIERGEILNLLGRLVDKSLVLADPTSYGSVRYRTLETLRQYGREQLDRRGNGSRERTEGLHAQFFIQLAETAEPQILGAQQLSGLQMLDGEHDNIRVSLRRMIAGHDVEGAQRLAGAVRPFWLVRNYLREGRAWLVETLTFDQGPSGVFQEGRGSEEASAVESLTRRAKVLHGLASLSYFEGDYDAARQADGAALALWRQLGDEAHASFSLLLLGQIETDQGNFLTGRQFLEAGVAAGRASRQAVPLSLNLFYLSQIALEEGDFSESRTMGEESLLLASKSGYSGAISNSLLALSDLSIQEGDSETARGLLQQAVAKARETGHRSILASGLAGLGRLAVDEGDYAAACPLLYESLTLSRDDDGRRVIAQVLEQIAALAVATERPAAGLRLSAAAAVLRDVMQTPLRPSERLRLESWLASARTSLAEAVAATALEDGRALSMGQAIAAALELVDLSSRSRHRSSSSADARHRVRGSHALDALTPRELEVADLIARGLSNRRIGQELVISEKTAANHVAHILEKLSFDSRTDLAAHWEKEEDRSNPESIPIQRPNKK